MKPIKFTCDSACDLTAQLYQKYAIAPVPLQIWLGCTSLQDGVTASPADVYAYVDQTGKLPPVEPPTAADYAQVFSFYLRQGYQIIHISLSGTVSAFYRNACDAARTLSDVAVVDSCNVSSGAGHLAILGVELSHAGLDAREILRALEDMKQRLTTCFLLDSPAYLEKFSRGSALALLGCHLRKKRPSLLVNRGKLALGQAFAGDWDHALTAFLRSQLENAAHIQHDRLFVTHTGLAPDKLSRALGLIRELQSFDDILVTTAGCFASRQGGPGCLGIHYLRTA